MSYHAIENLGSWLRQTAGNPGDRPVLSDALESRLQAVTVRNPWFSRDQVLLAFQSWGQSLLPESIRRWVACYPRIETSRKSRTIGIINAGNIPLVGLHDLLSVLITGHDYLGKNASDDPYLLTWMAELLIAADPSLGDRIRFTERLHGMDAVIATGSDNSARYFEHYFKKYPHIIRKNRNGVAVLTGTESSEELTALGKDIFSFFGLGCRNVAKVYVPEGYDFDSFFAAQVDYASVMGHNKYMNNVEYNNTVFLMKGLPFLSNNFLLLREDPVLASPIGVLHYERYTDLTALSDRLAADREKIQCAVCQQGTESVLRLNTKVEFPYVRFGQTQFPSLLDYADGIDTVRFLLELE